MEDELKPCPFCGSHAKVLGSDENNEGFYASCMGDNCWATVGENYDRDAMPDHMFRTEEIATTTWNTRAQPATAALREALELAWSLLDPFDMPPGAADKINAALGTSGASRGIDAALSHPTPEGK